MGNSLLDLSDTTIKLYRKMDGSVSVKLNSHLMIHTKGQGFCLSTYLNQLDCSLTLDTGEEILLDEYQYSLGCIHKMGYMIHTFNASGKTKMEVINDGAGLLKIEYRLFSYPGQSSPDVIAKVVPVLARGPSSQRNSSNQEKWIKFKDRIAIVKR